MKTVKVVLVEHPEHPGLIQIYRDNLMFKLFGYNWTFGYITLSYDREVAIQNAKNKLFGKGKIIERLVLRDDDL